MTFNRKPLTPGCFPTPGASIPASVDDPCAMLPVLRAKLYSAMSGDATQQVRDGERWKTTHNPNIKELRAEIRKLETICDPNAGARAVRAGPYVPSEPGFGFPFGRRYPF